MFVINIVITYANIAKKMEIKNVFDGLISRVDMHKAKIRDLKTCRQ